MDAAAASGALSVVQSQIGCLGTVLPEKCVRNEWMIWAVYRALEIVAGSQRVCDYKLVN